MIIDCISDLHGFYPEMPGGDLLIVAGDLTRTDRIEEYFKFFCWIAKTKYKKRIVIAGNHDGFAENNPEYMKLFSDFEYLCNSGTELEGLKIWGSPYTPTFYDWHFMADRGETIKKHWDLIPDDTDILVTHGPPYGILDKTIDGENVGCEELSKSRRRIRPRLHVFGHIHESYGMQRPNLDFIDCPGYPIFVNASHVNERYQPVNAPIRIIL